MRKIVATLMAGLFAASASAQTPAASRDARMAAEANADTAAAR